jgi:hypothetical protein
MYSDATNCSPANLLFSSKDSESVYVCKAYVAREEVDGFSRERFRHANNKINDLEREMVTVRSDIVSSRESKRITDDNLNIERKIQFENAR